MEKNKFCISVKRPIGLLLLLLFFTQQLKAQNNDFPFEVKLKADSIQGFAGLHSFAWGQRGTKVILIGGRPDGMHARQPFNAFPASQNNQQIQLLDLVTKQLWTRSLQELPTALQEQLQSTNMNFYQDDNALILTGGYAFSNTANDHITFPYLTRIHLDGLIAALTSNQPISTFFEQIQDERFAVTGGNLAKIGAQYYLVGGHRFDGRYNPMSMPTFVQAYVDGLKKFELSAVTAPLAVINYQTVADQINLHRRDYNLVPHIYPDSSFGYLISSGVFQLNADLPFLYPVEIHPTSHLAVNGFSQYLSNYHSAKFSAFDASTATMHHLFLGGISQYYYQNGTIVNDPNVPFVKTISRLSQEPDGTYHEYIMNSEMPALLGASAEFIPKSDLPYYTSEILDLNAITADSLLIGYLVGGLKSTALNPFTANNTAQTSANAIFYEVWLKKTETNAIPVQNPSTQIEVSIFPNPATEEIHLDFELAQKANVELFVLDQNGRLVHEVYYEKVKKANKTIDLKSLGLAAGNYTLQFILDDQHTLTKNIQIQ
ncbi:MAG: hypothetical protein RLZZ65_968 [Bacteroidota bacterium]|jgi:hypothetical protein